MSNNLIGRKLDKEASISFGGVKILSFSSYSRAIPGWKLHLVGSSPLHFHKTITLDSESRIAWIMESGAFLPGPLEANP